MAKLSDNTPDTPTPSTEPADSTDPADGGSEVDELDDDAQDTEESEATQANADQVEPGLDRMDPEGGGVPDAPLDDQPAGVTADDDAEPGPDRTDPDDAATDRPDARLDEDTDESTDVQDAEEGTDVPDDEDGEVQDDDKAAETQDNEDRGDSPDKENELSERSTGGAAKESAIEIGSRVAGRELGISRLYEDGIKPIIDTIRALGGPRGTVAALRAYASRAFRRGRGGGE